MAVFTLLVIAVLCLVFKSTRLAGVVGLTLLCLLNPIVFVSLLAIGVVAFFFIRYYNRSKNHALPKLP